MTAYLLGTSTITYVTKNINANEYWPDERLRSSASIADVGAINVEEEIHEPYCRQKMQFNLPKQSDLLYLNTMMLLSGTSFVEGFSKLGVGFPIGGLTLISPLASVPIFSDDINV